MNRLVRSWGAATARLSNHGDWLLPSLARLIFAGVLAGYFWSSAATKLDGGPFSLSIGAFAQIFPRQFEAVGYDQGQLGLLAHLVALAGAWVEVLLPLLLVLGLFTRLSALGMIGFVVVQSLTDVFGHMVGPETVGAWFDHIADAAILDQRALWIMLFVTLICKGAGPLSLDRLLRQWVSG